MFITQEIAIEKTNWNSQIDAQILKEVKFKFSSNSNLITILVPNIYIFFIFEANSFISRKVVTV